MFKSTILILGALYSLPTQGVNRFKDFCKQHLFSRNAWIQNDPYEGHEVIKQAKRMFGGDTTEVREFLKNTYYFEVNRPNPRESVVRAIEAYFGGKP